MASAASATATTMMATPSSGLKKTFVFNPISQVPKIKSASSRAQLVVRAASSEESGKEQVVAGLTATALAAAFIIPDVAEAATPGVSPSLKNFLLSILAGGTVLGVIVGAVVGVANFDPVKRS